MSMANSSPWQLLRPFLARRRLLLLAAVAAAVAAAFMTLAVPAAFRTVIDNGFATAQRNLNAVFVWPLVLSVLLAVASAARAMFGALLGETLATDLKQAITAHALTFDPQILDTLPSGVIISRISSDTAVLQDVLIPAAAVAVRNILLLLGGVIMAFIAAPTLMLYALLLILPLLLLFKMVIRRGRNATQQVQQADETTNQLLQESMNMLPTWQALGIDSLFGQKLRAAISAAGIWRARRAYARGGNVLVVVALVFVAITLVLRIGAGQVLDGAMSGGTLAAFVLYTVFAAGAASSLSELRTDIGKARSALINLQNLFAQQAAVAVVHNPLPMPTVSKAYSVLRLENVSFGFSNRDNNMLQNVSFSVAHGQMVVLTGASGLGKSALFLLLLRLRVPQAGGIYFANTPIDRLPVAELRQRMAYVPQDPVLMQGTLRENLLLGRTLPADVINKACAAADLNTVLTQLPQGFDTHVGERGQALSGGQRARVALARALLRPQTDLLLLDEPTAALDAAAEQRIVQHLRQSGHTTLCISHAPAIINAADTVLTLQADGTLARSI
jgi:ATP-binding cassette, subfamily B, bacterial